MTARLLAIALGVPLLLGGCATDEFVQVRTAGTQSMGIVDGAVLPNPPPAPRIELREHAGRLELRATWVGFCNRVERRVENRVRTTRTRMATTVKVVTGLIAGAGMALYMWPDLDASTSLTGGTVLVAAGAIPFAIGVGQEGEKTEKLPPHEVDRPAPLGPCVVGPVSHEPVVIEGENQILEGETNAQGFIQFDSTLSQPVLVKVGGRRIANVEWVK